MKTSVCVLPTWTILMIMRLDVWGISSRDIQSLERKFVKYPLPCLHVRLNGPQGPPVITQIFLPWSYFHIPAPSLLSLIFREIPLNISRNAENNKSCFIFPRIVSCLAIWGACGWCIIFFLELFVRYQGWRWPQTEIGDCPGDPGTRILIEDIWTDSMHKEPKCMYVTCFLQSALQKQAKTVVDLIHNIDCLLLLIACSVFRFDYL